MTKVNLRAVGTTNEERAVNYLKDNGYEILIRNYRIRQSEIDIIGKKNGMVVFFEVKYRSNYSFGTPREAVTKEKQRRICRGATHFLLSKGWWEKVPCRFDVIEMYGDNICHIENAFFYIK